MTQENQTAQNQLEESLSALVDGEATEMELHRILKSDDAELGQKWNRYQLARSAMKKDLSLTAAIDVSAAVSAAIADEALPSATEEQPAKSKGVWGNLGRLGVAASVAGAVILGVQFGSTDAPINVAENAPAVSGQPILGAGTTVRVVGQQAEIIEPIAEDTENQSENLP